MAKERAKTKKTTVYKRKNNFVPEKVYKVVPKHSAIGKPKKRLVKSKPKSLVSILKTPIATPYFIIFLVAVMIIGLVSIGVIVNNLASTINQTNLTINNSQYDKDTIKRLHLIGDTEDYPAEIANYQSAPADLQPYILNDYKMLKTNCIVNGNFAGPISYNIINVVYDNFARIEKNCNGVDTILLKKISGNWTVIYSGNDLPKCSDVNAFGIPQGISYNCRDGLVRYINPNP